MTGITLLQPFRRGVPSQDAAEALYDAYYDSTYRQVVAAFGDPDLAEEATQEAFVRAFEQYGSLRDQSKFSPWVTSIALNVARDYVRRRRHRVQLVKTLARWLLSRTPPQRPQDMRSDPDW